MDISTLCIHGADNNTHNTGAVSVPIYQSATFAHLDVGKSTGYDYSRLQNPTREYLEKVMANLEQGTDALAFSTGMAAITALMELFSIGDHIIASGDLYGGTVRLFEHISRKNGLKFDYINTSDLDAVRGLIHPDTKAIYIESPTNPMMQVTDITAVCEIAKTFGLLVIVDNTFLTPYYQQPLVLGADIVVHSGTKYLSGHNDTLAGFLVTKNEDLSERLRFIYKTTGACLSPFDSWLLIRGIKTLAVRMDRQQENAVKLANWLTTQKKVNKVFYIGLPDHPDYAVSTKQASGFGSMISFEVDSETTAIQLLERLQLVLFAESLGGVETLITYPMLQTHADVPMEERLERGINDCLLRLSVGLENADDLIADFEQALN
ncbi:aminotransferase class I/II-fold pyridoxal phosphate-dependent enzyme [Anaerocolumna sedimenticola]|uniref:Aminotransferase class I/II-fold pyridoxal phosphate-dependent enzyme n=1 Tax=Anaerocolumna sedimenticola TaxID=2696063 RepID=A0A6P1TRM0_9FIRM|nr:PLP-dependent aspartate aminotransferase family protein [Anaerocolumna sedimenticola]QHQ62892.1 aminotransferase class I/II-fold pyridoxal phosphate-dependent enzyme [Anaerocolumna sedimenticola]